MGDLRASTLTYNQGLEAASYDTGDSISFGVKVVIYWLASTKGKYAGNGSEA